MKHRYDLPSSTSYRSLCGSSGSTIYLDSSRKGQEIWEYTINNKRTTKTITVLSGQMTVVPEGACLVRNIKVVKERVSWDYRTLCNKCGTVRPCSGFLEETVPVLPRNFNTTLRKTTIRPAYDGRRGKHPLVSELINDIEFEVIALVRLLVNTCLYI